jgi:hypothetical protein
LYTSVILFDMSGIRRFFADIELMFGVKTSLFWKICGPTGLYFRIMWMVVSPVLLAVIILLFKNRKLHKL